MTSIEQIESAILQLSPDDFRLLATWLQEQAEKRWDEQIEADARAGKLDALADQAIAQFQAGQFRSL